MEKDISMTAFSIYPFVRYLSNPHLPFEMLGAISMSWTKGAHTEYILPEEKMDNKKVLRVMWYEEGYPDNDLPYLSLQSFPVELPFILRDAWNLIKWIKWKYEKCGGDWEWCVWRKRKIFWWLPSLFYPSTHSLLGFYYLSRCLESYTGDLRGDGVLDLNILDFVWYIWIKQSVVEVRCYSVSSRRPPPYLELRAVSSYLHVPSSFCTEHKAVGQDIYERLLPVSSRFQSNDRYISI